ncbi:MAG: HAD-IA family hydrolase [Chloroflexi bacterium]|nr:HAD-IA family hydrolase [Chloroflexota bacterium]MBU1748473.1 HAD-IA family hydrolase [Chloroflexota bacterium]MBU1879413.1 HAD-IA family hydrolase [Chloroflexota bacterium]
MAEIKALIFDQDGVIIDTERDGHRVAFNRTFKEFGYDFEWDVDRYHELLQVAGGKERMKHYFHEEGLAVAASPAEEAELVKRLHKHKTEVFVALIESGELPVRPGVRRLMHEAMEAGLIIGVCTTSNERAARAVAYGILNDIAFDFVLAGDVVSKKKPDPEIYELALQRTGLRPEECLVIEDSRNGVLAAKAAGMHVVATTNVYTEREDLSEADLVVTCLGDPDGERGELRHAQRPAQPTACVEGGAGLAYDGVLRLEQLMRVFGG